MNVDLSNKMATQSWQPQSVQTPSSGQPSMAGPQGQRQSSTSANQSQGMASSNYNASPSVPSSPSNIVPLQFRSNTDSLNPSQSSSVPTGTSLPQAASPVSVSGYSSQPPLYTGARWPPPSPGHSPLPVPPSSGPQSISSVHNSQSSTVQQHAAIGTVQGPSGQSVPPVPSWQTQHAPSPVAPVSSGPPPSCSSSASQESSAVNCHPVSSFSPSLTAATTQTVSSGLAVPSVSLGSPLPAISAPPGLAPLSVSQVPVKVAAQPSTTGTPAQPGGASVVNVLSSMTNSSVVTGPSGPPAVQETSGSSAATPVKMTPATTSNPANLLVPPAVGSAPPGPPGISLTAHPASLTGAHQPPVDIARPGLLPSAIPTSAALPGAGSISTPSMPQQQQYVPYINVLPVPQLLPWAQGQPRPFPPFVNVPNPYLPPIRPVVPVVANSSMTKTSSDSTTPLAPPGEQETTVKASAPEGDKVLSVSSLSGQVVNGQPTPNTSNTISISSNVTESALGSELSSKVMEVADVWTAHRTLEGNVYYYNSVTGESTYEKPAGFHGEVDKVAAQPTPVSWESVGETGWVLVTTNDAKKYYFHKDTKATSWQVPAEVVEYRKKQIEEASLKISVGGEHVKPNSDKSTVSFSLTVPNVGNTTQKPAASAASSSALDLIKKKLQDSGLIASENIGSTDGNAGKTLISEGGKEKAKDNHAEKSSSESSSDSDDDEQGPTKEERILQFKEMLKEKGIAPFSKWEKELPKIIFDPRFKAIASHTERRSIFDHYVRTRAEEERKEKRALQKAAVEGFKQLLEEASKDINHNTEYEKFARKWAGDRRFEALERKDREALLNERVLPLRKAEEERIRAIQSAAAAGFKTMLAELGEITSSTRWSKVKDRLRNDPRYRTIMREEREAIFNAYVGELRAAELEAERAAKAKREEEEKRKEREREKRKRKEREEQEWEKARAKALKREATTGFQALLTERVKDPEASWTETRPKLEKDPLGRAMNPELDNIERERLFREHIKALYERALRDYRALLADVLATDLASKQNEEGKNMLNSWSEAKKHLKSDTRYAKMPRGDREAWWRRYAEDVSRKLKAGSNSSKEEKRSITEAGKATGLDGVWRNPGHR